jgi:hypothetical protein
LFAALRLTALGTDLSFQEECDKINVQSEYVESDEESEVEAAPKKRKSATPIKTTKTNVKRRKEKDDE